MDRIMALKRKKIYDSHCIDIGLCSAVFLDLAKIVDILLNCEATESNILYHCLSLNGMAIDVTIDYVKDFDLYCNEISLDWDEISLDWDDNEIAKCPIADHLGRKHPADGIGNDDLNSM